MNPFIFCIIKICEICDHLKLIKVEKCKKRLLITKGKGSHNPIRGILEKLRHGKPQNMILFSLINFNKGIMRGIIAQQKGF